MKKINQKGFGAAEVLIIIVVIALLGAAGWYVIQKKKKDDKQIVPTSSAQNSSSPAKGSKKTASSELVGTWQTDCLVPVANNKWAEKHQFVIEGNKATHTRWSDDTGKNDCSKPDMTIANHYTYTIPVSGQINLTDTDQQLAIYDIYKVSGSTLEFGHGFRQDYAGANKINGDTEANRIDSLNTYLVYTKK